MGNPELIVERVPITSLERDPDNARKHSRRNIDAIAGSLRTFGQRRPLVVWGDIIIAGNGTVEAAESLGWDEIEVTRVPVDWSRDQAKAFALADNRTAELAEWDSDVLAGQLIELDETGYDIDDWGFDPIDSGDEDTPLQDDPIADPPKDPVTKLGDVWIMGEHTLICGDSTDASAYKAVMGKERAAITFTSPPYNAGKSESLSGNTHMTDNKYGEGYGDDRDPREWLNLCNNATRESLRFSDYGIWNIQPLAGNKVALMEYLYEWRNNLADLAIWNKTHAAPQFAENVLNSQYEFLIILARDENPSRAIRTGSFRGNVPNVIDIPPQRNNEYSEVHAATFPIALPEWAIRNLTQPGDMILDPFAGTGTTMIAADQLDRRCAMIELDPRYCDVIVERWERHTGQKAQRRAGNKNG